jgi:hypothetical protein
MKFKGISTMRKATKVSVSVSGQFSYKFLKKVNYMFLKNMVVLFDRGLVIDGIFVMST